ncbi:MAG: GNAT family N-acetyltransferase [Lapillicoccus sp.]
MEISTGGLDRDDVLALLREHLADMHATSPPGSVHALDVAGLRIPSVTLWTVRESEVLLGCGALKELSATEGEVKSMRTSVAARGRGAATAVLGRIVEEARLRGYHRLSLETGTQDFFAPAWQLYERHGFVACGPFGDYVADPHSRFLTLSLR